MKVAIVGSRGLAVDNIGDYLPDGTDCIISGGAKGIDTCAAEYAKSHNLRLIEFLPDYKKYGRRAPIIRNADIVNECDYLFLGIIGMIFLFEISPKPLTFLLNYCIIIYYL